MKKTLSAVILIALSVSANASTPDYTKLISGHPIKLYPNVSCVSLVDIKSSQTPIELMVGAHKCLIKEDYIRAAEMTRAAHIYGVYDTLKVKDQYEQEIIQGLPSIIVSSHGAVEYIKIADQIKSIYTDLTKEKKFCQDLKQIEKPSYYPAYMDSYLVSKYNRPLSGLEKNFDENVTWNSIINDYHRCNRFDEPSKSSPFLNASKTLKPVKSTVDTIFYYLPENHPIRVFQNVSCVNLVDIKSTQTPVELMGGAHNCLMEKDYVKAAEMYHGALIYGNYDTYRVNDSTAHQRSVRRKLFLIPAHNAPEFEKLFDEYTLIKNDFFRHLEFCENVEKIEKPSYHPTYMLDDGVSNFTLKSFDPDTSWELVKREYLDCIDSEEELTFD